MDTDPLATKKDASPNKRTRRRHVLRSKDSALDEGDLLVLEEISSRIGVEVATFLQHGTLARTIRRDDGEYRLAKLSIDGRFRFSPRKIFSIPSSIGRLDNLESLIVRSCKIVSLPSSLGQLQNLKELMLEKNRNLSRLPQNIGSLGRLQKLSLRESGVKSLPSSIGRLGDLEHLDLSYTSNLLILPEEIGGLSSLNHLDLRGSKITALPPSVGHLQNLGNLNLNSSEITTLPSSIGRLENLQVLNLSYTRRLQKLPDEIGNLINLKRLGLEGCRIAPLPPSKGKLIYLTHTDLSGAFAPEPLSSSTEFLWKLVKSCKKLVVIDRDYCRGMVSKKVDYALACNRARSRMTCQWMPKAWPFMMHSAPHAFAWYPGTSWRTMYCSMYPALPPKPESIYHLLTDGREAFVRLIIARGTNES